MCVCHHCDTPACINLEHLFIDTIDGNNKDMWSKGRGKLPHRKGESANSAKLNEDDVRAIRAMHPEMSYSQLSYEFLVSEYAIYSAIHRKTWAHIV